MKHYIYQSKTKIDQYYDQIKANTIPSRQSKLAFNLGVISGSLQEERPAELSTHEKIEKIVSHIKSSGDYGSIDDDNAPYFSMQIPMKSGLFTQRENYQLAMWGGVTQNHVIALFGSLKHVLGYISDTHTDASSLSILFYNVINGFMQNDVIQNRDTRNLEVGKGSALKFSEAMMRAVRFLGVFDDYSVIENLEFFAVKYNYGIPNNSNGKKVVVGSPLYVALQ